MSLKKDPARAGRLASALKANLKRRKAQAASRLAALAPQHEGGSRLPRLDAGVAPHHDGFEAEADKGPNAAPKKQ